MSILGVGKSKTKKLNRVDLRAFRKTRESKRKIEYRPTTWTEDYHAYLAGKYLETLNHPLYSGNTLRNRAKRRRRLLAAA